jgi:phosphatidylglycerophosphate synthase
MSVTSALVFDSGSRITVGGLTLTERAVLLAQRAGLRPVRVWGDRALDPESVARLRARGAAIIQLSPSARPFEAAGDTEGVVAIGPDVLFGPSVLASLSDIAAQRERGANGPATAVCEAATPLLLSIPPGVQALHACDALEAMASNLPLRVPAHELPVADGFCRRVDRAHLARSAERDYTRHLNGRGESYFTKKIRRFSVPLTSGLVPLGAHPTHVTLGGLALATASAWCVAQGSYGAGLLGAVLYYASMIFDCSDGEVARLTLRDGPFGAWLETFVDYATYFLLLAALVVASHGGPDAEATGVVTAIAIVGSIVVIAVTGYLRHRVAAADPGQFDEASAKALASAGGLHRFAQWGRQWIKRSTVAHLIVALAVIDQLPLLLYLWAFGATVASVVVLAVEPFVVRRVAVAAAGRRRIDGDSESARSS